MVFTLQRDAYIRQLAELKVKEMGLNVYDEIKARQSLPPTPVRPKSELIFRVSFLESYVNIARTSINIPYEYSGEYRILEA